MTAIQLGDNKIGEIYYGATQINSIYKGDQLVYQYSSYNVNEELINYSQQITVNFELKPGRYYI